MSKLGEGKKDLISYRGRWSIEDGLLLRLECSRKCTGGFRRLRSSRAKACPLIVLRWESHLPSVMGKVSGEATYVQIATAELRPHVEDGQDCE